MEQACFQAWYDCSEVAAGRGVNFARTRERGCGGAGAGETFSGGTAACRYGKGYQR